MSTAAARADAFYSEVLETGRVWTVRDARGLPGLTEDGIRVGLNWSGPRATGYDVGPASVEAALTARGPAGKA